jgi:hypothetical protein
MLTETIVVLFVSMMLSFRRTDHCCGERLEPPRRRPESARLVALRPSIASK